MEMTNDLWGEMVKFGVAAAVVLLALARLLVNR